MRTLILGALGGMWTLGACDRTDANHRTRLPVEGPSWLHQLGVSVEDTTLGKQGGTASPPARALAEPDPTRDGARFQWTGADLYRVACQACHGPSGTGAPPEIPSVIGAVQATSADALRRRAEEAGRSIAPAMAEQLATDARATLTRRLEQGGERMPAFPGLTEVERAALIDELQRRAGVDTATAAGELAVSAERAGALVLRGTCHLCHDATGPGSPHRTMMEGEIPSLASLPRYWPLDAVIAKVRSGVVGGRGMMGGMGHGMMHGPARMPVYPYLTPQEIAAAYLALRR